MHILITAVSAAQGPSGICRHASTLARCATSREEVSRVTILVGSWQESYFRNLFALHSPKLVIVSVNVANRAVARNAWYLWGLPTIAKTLHADIVHLSFPVPIRRASFNCPVVVTLHDLYPYDEPGNFGFPRVLANRIFLRSCMRAVDSVICVSETTLARLRLYDRGIAKKSLVIHNCMDITSVECDASASAWTEDRPFIVMVAQHRANKNILLALKAFVGLLQQPEISKEMLLLVIGNCGPETSVIMRSICQQKLRRNVRLLNSMTDKELIWLYRNCELLIAPSSNEGFGLPVVEGLMCGSRVVCSDIPTFREVGGRACYYFELRTASPSSAMIVAICNALANRTGRVESPERFSLQSIAKKYVALCLRLKVGAPRHDLADGDCECERSVAMCTSSRDESPAPANTY